MAGGALVPVNKGGRPTSYTRELAIDICSRIAEGETLLEICREEGMPAERTVRGWDLALVDDGWFSTAYARARAMQIEHEVDEIKVISTTPMLGATVTTKQFFGKNGEVQELTELKQADMLEHRRLMIEARKWRAGKIAWHKYGERLANMQAARGDDGEEDGSVRVIVTGGLPDREPGTE